MWNTITQFSFPTTIIYGPGARNRIPTCLKELGIQKPLLVTDPGLRQTPAYAAVEEALKSQKVNFILTTDVHPNPIEEDVERCGAAFKKNRCDSVIGLGGGSALDVAKVVPVRVALEGPLASFEAQAGGYERITGSLPPMLAVPTTAGTGSEVGRSGVITVPKLGRKIVIFSPLLMPKRAIADPELTVGLPPGLTAATGMDAFTHCLESLAAPLFHPFCDAIALGGLELVIKYLERAVKNCSDLEARGYMMISAMMGAISFQKDLGAAHSLAHPLSTEYNVHHGLANAICLPITMHFNLEAAEKPYARLAALFGVPVHEMSERDAAARAVDEVDAFNRRLGITQRLRDFNIPEDALAVLARKAFADSCHKTNPRPCTENDLHQMYKGVW